MRKEPPHERWGSPEHGALHSEGGAWVGGPTGTNPIPQWHSSPYASPAYRKRPASHPSIQVAEVLFVDCAMASPTMTRERVSTTQVYWVIQPGGSGGAVKQLTMAGKPKDMRVSETDCIEIGAGCVDGVDFRV